MVKLRALCKYRNMLVIAEISKCDGTSGQCPECGGTKFYRRAGWIECECGFAINEADYEKIML